MTCHKFPYGKPEGVPNRIEMVLPSNQQQHLYCSLIGQLSTDLADKLKSTYRQTINNHPYYIWISTQSILSSHTALVYFIAQLH